MQQFRKLLFPALTLCFILVLLGYYIGRKSVNGVILTPHQTPEPAETAAERLIPTVPVQTEGRNGGRLDLNRATLEELMELPGIGQVRAQSILDYRAEHGPFRLTSDLMNVSGIGEGIYAGLRDLIYVEESNENTDH